MKTIIKRNTGKKISRYLPVRPRPKAARTAPQIKKEKMIKRSLVILWFWTPVILWAAIIFYMSTLPSDGTPFIDIPNIDKFFHIVEYFIFGALLARAFSNSITNPNYKYILAVSILIAAFYGASDEFHQRFVPGRSCDVFDLLSDIIGASIGAALAIYKERISRAVDKAV